MKSIIMYGTTWCPDCHRSKQVLEKNKIAYKWINLDEDPKAASKVE